ncbi:MAG: DUF4007 family protein [bacterium]
MAYTFARHETFHIRTGWLRKGLNAIDRNDHIFLETIPAMDELGIGKNMINSLRYWLLATKLTEECYENGQKVQRPTELANIIMEYDTYFEDPATFWLLHYQLAINKEEATTWYWFFNYFNYSEFDKKTFVERLTTYIKRTGEEPPAQSSLESDFKVLRKMYLSKEENIDKKNKDYNPEEELMASPFKDLRLLIETDDNKLKINRPTVDKLPVQILFYCLLESLNKGETSINVDDLMSKENSIGRVFKLTPNILYTYLEQFQELNYIRLAKQAGLNSVTILEDSQEKILEYYYLMN